MDDLNGYQDEGYEVGVANGNGGKFTRRVYVTSLSRLVLGMVVIPGRKGR